MVSEPAERTLRRQRADGTRARLFDAAAELLLDRGYHATTVEQIARKAGVAKGTFFVHFASKDAIVLELVTIQTGAARRARSKAIADGAGSVEALAVAVMTLGERAGFSRNISRAVLAAGLENPTLGASVSAKFDEVLGDMTEDARRAKRDGLLGRHVDPEQLAGQLMVLYLGSALHFTSTPGAKPLVEVLRPLVENTLALARAPSRESTDVHTLHRDASVRARRGM